MKKILILLCFAAFTASAKNPPVVKVTPVRLELKYSAAYVANEGEFKSSNVEPTIQLGYRTGDGQIIAGIITDAEATKTSVFLGSQYDFIKKGKCLWYGMAFGRVELSESKTFATGIGGGLSYSLGKLISIDSNMKLTYFGNSPQQSMSLGVIAKFR